MFILHRQVICTFTTLLLTCQHLMRTVFWNFGGFWLLTAQIFAFKRYTINWRISSWNHFETCGFCEYLRSFPKCHRITFQRWKCLPIAEKQAKSRVLIWGDKLLTKITSSEPRETNFLRERNLNSANTLFAVSLFVV